MHGRAFGGAARTAALASSSSFPSASYRSFADGCTIGQPISQEAVGVVEVVELYTPGVL